MKPTSGANLASSPILEPIKLDAELNWVSGRILKSASLVRRHVELLQELDALLLHDKGKEAEQLARAAANEVGMSMTWIAIAIGVIQLVSGMEAQKVYVRELRESGASRMLQFFSHWWSVRAEDNTSTGHFITEIMRRIGQWETTPKDEAQILYYLFNEVPGAGEEQNLLAVAASSSVIDAYEMLVAVATKSAAESRPSTSYLVSVLRTIQGEVSDARLEKISFLIDPNGPLPSLPTDFQFRQAELEQTVVDKTTPGPNGPCELFSAFRNNSNKCEARSSWFGDLNNAVSTIGSSPDSHVDDLETLNKLGLILCPTSFGRVIAALASSNSSGVSPFSPVVDAVTYVNSSDSIIEAHSCLPAESWARIADELLTSLPKSLLGAYAGKLATGADSSGSLRRLSKQSTDELKLRRALKSGDVKIIHQLTSSLECTSRMSTFLRSKSNLERKQYETALREAGSLVVKNNSFIHWLPSDELLKSAYSESENLYPSLLQTSIIMDVFEREIDSSISSFSAYAAEDYVLEHGVDKPSQLPAPERPEDQELHIYYLDRVCTAERLRFFSAFDSERDLETERIDICLLLANTDETQSDRYELEARSIVTGRVVKEGLKQLDASKISIDELALRAWATKNLLEDFARYQAFYSSGLVPIGDEYRRSLLDALEQGAVPTDLFDVPQNEAISLFRDMVTRYVQQCAFDTEHGLDCYLSLRIRHGTMSGELRSASERENVVTRRSKESGAYLPNTHWAATFSQIIPRDDWETVEDRLFVFSGKLDELITTLTTQFVQIRRPEKPEGLFEISVSPLQIYSLVVDTNDQTKFEDFLFSLNELFWASIQTNLVKVRDYVDVAYREQILALFDGLEQDLRFDARLRPLADAVLRARNETSQAIDQVRDWFELPAATSNLAFGLEEMVTISTQTMQRFHPDFNPSISVEAEGLPKFQGALNLFSDIFFVAFENIYKHSGSPTPTVRVHFHYESRELTIRVTNSLSESLNVEQLEEMVGEARVKVQSDEFLNLVRREGGTGLPKLANLLGVRSGLGKLDFGVSTDDRKFWLTVGLPATLLETKEEFHAEFNIAG
ncbi:MAG: hypothetical protein CME85_14650 [Henriciella sp.]|nr:hypothetical protein [Henriciella sp.]MBK76707.1 hypothetical protein [Henriciella sp.]PHR82202.1 MAG: hypothetical protein COA64_02020 [Henriciella sp.]